MWICRSMQSVDRSKESNIMWTHLCNWSEDRQWVYTVYMFDNVSMWQCEYIYLLSIDLSIAYMYSSTHILTMMRSIDCSIEIEYVSIQMQSIDRFEGSIRVNYYIHIVTCTIVLTFDGSIDYIFIINDIITFDSIHTPPLIPVHLLTFDRSINESKIQYIHLCMLSISSMKNIITPMHIFTLAH
jgi:hypothetical protein